VITQFYLSVYSNKIDIARRELYGSIIGGVVMKRGILFGIVFLSTWAHGRILSCRELLTQPAATYDYVVVGAGPGGAPLASRLAMAGHSVLLIDAGGPDQPKVSQVPALHAVASEHGPIALDYGVAHYADPTQAAKDSKYDANLPGGILYPRGEGVGGSALVNAMITVLPHRGDFDRLGRLLDDPYFSDDTMWRIWREKIEDCRYRWLLRAAHRTGECLRLPFLMNFGDHGFGGWLQTTQPRLSLAAKILWRDPQLRKIILGAEKARRGSVGGFIPYFQRLMSKFDPNDRRSIDRHETGIVLTPQAIDTHGRRHGARAFVMDTERKFPENLHIVSHTLVDRVVFDGKKAVGVEVIARENGLGAEDEPKGPELGRRLISARKEVVLSGGAFETPAALIRSGIGPQSELSRLGIDPVAFNEHVGHNLHDRYEVGVISEFASPIALLDGATFSVDPNDPFMQEWEQGRGINTTNGAIIAFTARSNPLREVPDLFIFGLPASFRGYRDGYSKELTENPNAFTWAVLVAQTQNRGGVVTLSSTDPTVQPLIDFKYFEQGGLADEQALMAGVDIVRKLNARMPRGLFKRELSPGARVRTVRDVREWVRNESWGHHAVGTAALGTVLDSHFRVKGVTGLRVVDASVFPDIPGYFLVSSVYVISEMAAERILQESR